MIRKANNLLRVKLIILHRSPYSSLPARLIPGNPTNEKWIELSQHWRLEHELTHLATKRLAGKLRLTSYDEQIDDALGMLKSLKIFSGDFFSNGTRTEYRFNNREKWQGSHIFKRVESAR